MHSRRIGEFALMNTDLPRSSDDPRSPSERGTDEPSGPARRPSIKSLVRKPSFDQVLLLVMATSFVAIISFLCQLRYENFLTYDWDLGLNQQMLWSTTHGRLLYETADLEFYGVHSFLQIHSTYIAIPFSLVYSAAPFAGTLFVIQSAAFASSVFPLYLIARRILASRALTFSLIGIYLIGFTVISALFFDFHWESFIPVEFLSFYYLVERRRYAWSIVPALLGMLTLEVFPFLIVGVVLCGLADRVDKVGFWRDTLFRDRDTRILASLLVLAVVGYALLRLAEYWIIPHAIGQPSVPIAGSQDPLVLFALTASSATLPQSTIYWLLLLASLGMLPLLAPRFLLLSVPWVFASVFVTPAFSDNFGDQYSLIAIAPLAVAAANGLAWLEGRGVTTRKGLPTSVLLVVTSASLVGLAVFEDGSRELLSGILAPPAWVVLLLPMFGLLLIVPWRTERLKHVPKGLASVILPPITKPVRRALRRLPFGLLLSAALLSVVMSPLNPTNTGATQYPGYFGFQWNENPVAGEMGWILGEMPRNATVLASDNLFPYLANDPNAYPVPWYQVTPGDPPFFPFSANVTPKFVLVDSSQFAFLPPNLQPVLWNSSVYGLVAYIFYQQYPGSLYLFEHGFTGALAVRNLSPLPSNYYFTGANLSIGPSGQGIQDGNAKFGVAVESVQATNPAGNGQCIWYGPYATFPPGQYTVTLNLSGNASPASRTPNPQLLLVDASGLGSPGYYFLQPIFAAQLSGTSWAEFHFNVTIDKPYPNEEIRGYLVYPSYSAGARPNGQILLNYVEVTRE